MNEWPSFNCRRLKLSALSVRITQIIAQSVLVLELTVLILNTLSLAWLSQTVISDPALLKHGVRYIFALDGSIITDVDQLEDGCSYVCSSTPVFKRLDYEGMPRVDWVSNSRRVSTPAVVPSTESFIGHLNQRRQPYTRNGTPPTLTDSQCSNYGGAGAWLPWREPGPWKT